MIITASIHKNIPAHTPVFNLYQLEYYMWIDVPDESAQCTKLYELNEISPTGKTSIPLTENLDHDYNRSLFRLKTDVLNLSSGFHMYEMKFIRNATDEIFSLYFSYIIQQDNPDKPYIYMKSNAG